MTRSVTRFVAVALVALLALAGGLASVELTHYWGSGAYFGAALGLLLAFWLVRLNDAYVHERPIRGLGDVVAIVLTSLGVPGWKGCGCSERRDRWNARWPSRRYQVGRLREELRSQRWEAANVKEAFNLFVREAEAFKAHALGLLSQMHERLVKRESGDHAWYVAGPMPEVVPFLTENDVGARTIEQANPSALLDDSPGASLPIARALQEQDEAVEPRDYTSRR